jgi:hypothetical protein
VSITRYEPDPPPECLAGRSALPVDPGTAGHTSVAFTLDRYGHLFEGHDDELRERLDAMHAQGLRAVPAGGCAARDSNPEPLP